MPGAGVVLGTKKKSANRMKTAGVNFGKHQRVSGGIVFRYDFDVVFEWKFQKIE